MMLADADGALTRAIGLVVSLPALGLGERSEPFSTFSILTTASSTTIE